ARRRGPNANGTPVQNLGGPRKPGTPPANRGCAGEARFFARGGNKPPAPGFLTCRGRCAMGMPGSRRTVERLVEEHYIALYRYAYRPSGGEADAEAPTQEAFGKAQMTLSQLRQTDRAKNWLFTILRNAYLHRVRTDRQPPAVPLDLAGDVPEALPDSLPDVDPE